MSEIHQQVGPAVQRAEEARDSAQAARLLERQRERMFRSLVVRAREVTGRLGVEAPALAVGGNADTAAYLGFFENLVAILEGAVTNLDDLVDDGSRELLQA